MTANRMQRGLVRLANIVGVLGALLALGLIACYARLGLHLLVR